MSKNKKWEKLQKDGDKPSPPSDERTFDRKEIIKALKKIRAKRPMIKSSS